VKRQVPLRDDPRIIPTPPLIVQLRLPILTPDCAKAAPETERTPITDVSTTAEILSILLPFA
jgi:hypothetical protein